jgi:Uma2 family endonuclease
MLTEQHYLALERAAEFKSEYFDGEMFAMSGASMRHADLQSNIQGELFSALRSGDCRVYGPDFNDRGLKFKHYRTIASLQDYILVTQTEIRIEHYTRQADNLWILRDYQSLEEEMTISSIAVSLPLGRIYDRAEFPAA